MVWAVRILVRGAVDANMSGTFEVRAEHTTNIYLVVRYFFDGDC